MSGDRAAGSLQSQLARWRVPLGFACAALVFALAQPTWPRLVAGLAVAAVGEAIRFWAAGHLEKGREVTASGPYRWVEHPLYIGSGVMGVGVAVASRTAWAAIVVALYIGLTLAAAIRTEEAALRATFGATYDSYRSGVFIDRARRFSMTRARRNREHRAAFGVAVGFGLLALKLALTM
ncbi:MAG: isoprenylcysteine carboxylmethyltransferase family protein [Acidobacteria bacterium]|nr:isoprenylcysteine carboxylmethyltransferase family protein [Acidobacteriota bacterium]